MTATTFIRTAVRKRIETLINAELAGIDVEVRRNEPRDLPDNYVILGPTRGLVEYPVMAPSLPRDDQFSIMVFCRCKDPGDGAADAEERVEQYANAVMAAVSPAPTGDPLNALDGVLEATISASDGPLPVPAEEGFAAYWSLTIDVHTRIVREP